MKKLIATMVLSGILTVAVVNSATAQIDLPEVSIIRPEQLPLKAFESTFPDAKAPRWFHRNKKYIVTFLMDDIKHNALFSKNGKLIYQIAYGNQNTIPDNFQPQVEERFDGYDIIAAINVKQNGRDVWLITGEGKRDFLNVSIVEGLMSEGTKVKRYDVKPGKTLAKSRTE